MQRAIRLIRTRRFVPVTAATALAFALLGVATGTWHANITPAAHAWYGFAPSDVRWFDLARALRTALVSDGATAFWSGLAAVVVLTGAVEMIAGSGLALVGFWGVHLATLVGQALLLGPLRFAHAGAAPLWSLRDVGPSAGYFGCLGLLIALLPGRWRAAGIAGALIALAVTTVSSVMQSGAIGVSAASAHAIALPAGFVVGLLATRLRSLHASRA